MRLSRIKETIALMLICSVGPAAWGAQLSLGEAEREVEQRFGAIRSATRSPEFVRGQLQLPLDGLGGENDPIPLVLKHRHPSQISYLVHSEGVDESSFAPGAVKLGIGAKNQLRLFLVAGVRGQIYYLAENGNAALLHPTDSSLPIALENGDVLERAEVEAGYQREVSRAKKLALHDKRAEIRKKDGIKTLLAESAEGRILLSLLEKADFYQSKTVFESDPNGFKPGRLQIATLSNTQTSLDLIISPQPGGITVVATKEKAQPGWTLLTRVSRLENYLFYEQFSNGSRHPFLDRALVLSSGSEITTENFDAYQKNVIDQLARSSPGRCRDTL